MRRRPRRAPRRRAKKSNSGVSKGQLKQYTYNFRLNDQHLFAENGGTAQSFASTGGVGPLNILANQVPSTTSIDNWHVYGNSIYNTNFASIGGNITFSVNDLLNWGPFKGIYDNYRINYINVSVEYLNNVSTASGGGLMPTLYMFVDQDGLASGSPPTVASDLTDRQGVRKFTFSSSKTRCSMRIKPKLGLAVQDIAGAGFVARVQTNGWVDIQGPSAAYYGLLFWLEDFYANGAAPNALRWSFTYNISLNGALNLH